MIPYNKNLTSNAKELRKNMTPEEKHLWYDFLRYYPVKIYKQRIIDNFIADFYCHSARLVIELDGSQHYKLKARNTMKQELKFLKSMEYLCCVFLTRMLMIILKVFAV